MENNKKEALEKKSKYKILSLLAVTIILAGMVIFFRFSKVGVDLLWNISLGGKWLLPLVTVAAMLDSINPCAISVLIITMAFLFSLGAGRRKIFQIGSSYIFGLLVVYILIGLGILGTLHLFNTPHFMAKLGALILMAFGAINIINEFFPAFTLKLKIPKISHQKMAEFIQKASLPSAFFLGSLVGLCEFPCTGGPYLMIIGLLHDKSTYFKGLGYLIYYNLIFVLPLIILLLTASNELVLAKFQQWKKTKTKKVKLWSGVAMILFGVLIFSL